MNNAGKFYDEFISKQIKSGINDRIYSLYKRLMSIGLTKANSILEIGCGIGVLTYLISRKIKNIKIEAIDISPKSISYAHNNLPKGNLYLTSGDILEYQPINPYFDFILLFDVLEHIPIEHHKLLFEKLSNLMHNDSKLLINIPNPDYIVFDQKYNPAVLQELDQPIFLDYLASILSRSSLTIEYFETYSIWVKNDYQFLIVKKKTDFSEEKLNTSFNLFKKVKKRLNRQWRKIIFNYPRKYDK
jgi:trans-aconitate 2-methyltransferase